MPEVRASAKKEARTSWPGHEFSVGIDLVHAVQVAHTVALFIEGDFSGQPGEIFQIVLQIGGEFVGSRVAGCRNGLDQSPVGVSGQYGPDGTGIAGMNGPVGGQEILRKK